MSSVVSVQLDAVAALADDLVSLAAELADDARLCRSVAAPITAALGGSEGWRAGTIAVAWSTVTATVAEQAAAVADALRAALDGYRAADAALADRVCAADPGYAPR
jgi:hypothetical protein